MAANGKRDAGAFVGVYDGLATLRIEHGKKEGGFSFMVGADSDGAAIQLERAGGAEVKQVIKKN